MDSFFVWFVFFIWLKDKELKQQLLAYLKWLPIIVIVALPFFALTQMEENFQGRKAGIEQLKDNASSVFSSNGDGSLEDNKIWRLVWWAKIVDYTFGGEFFLGGKGLGPALSISDDIALDEGDGELRSPHNFNMRFWQDLECLFFYFGYIGFISYLKIFLKNKPAKQDSYI